MVVKPFTFLFHSQGLNECTFPKIVGKVHVALDTTNSRELGIDDSEFIQGMGVLAPLNFCQFINRKNFCFAFNGIFQRTQRLLDAIIQRLLNLGYCLFLFVHTMT